MLKGQFSPYQNNKLFWLFIQAHVIPNPYNLLYSAVKFRYYQAVVSKKSIMLTKAAFIWSKIQGKL